MKPANRLLGIAVLLAATVARADAAPAARAGDPTSHGGVIVVGSPTVLVGGRPAARLGDFASCPLFNGTVPHVGGPIVTGAPTVLVNGVPAARMGDTVAEAGPSSVVIGGAPTVVIGSSGVR